MGGVTIARKDIDKVRARVRDVADILQTLQTPGVLVRRRSDQSLCVGYTSGQVRMYQNVSGGCVPMTVYINDVRATNTDLALQMPVESIDRIVIFRPLEAGALFGADASNGVIIVYTHNR
jgi:outer membrane receptor for ferrienterochelin and colicin